jgi:pyruvate dehydrogenase E2 component (dihydrolipoamide acetyltransferase)
VSIEIVMPVMEMAQDTAKLLRWAKNEGDYVAEGEVLMEIETDKATVEIESTGCGVLSRVTAHAGDQVPVGQVIAVLLDAEGHSPTAAGRAVAFQGGLEERIQSAHPDLNNIQRTRSKVKGSGLGAIGEFAAGRAARANDFSDILAARSGAASNEYTALRLTGKRKVIADKTQKSHQIAPHISLSLSIDMSEVQKLRERGKTDTENEGDISPNLTSILLKAAVVALVKHPQLNAHLVDDEIRQYSRIHLGVAVAVDDGVIVPVIRNAGQKGTPEIHHELEDLVLRARRNRLKREEVTGSTFTVTNLGMFGIERFSAILNPPEVAILSLGCTVDKAIKTSKLVEFRPFLEATINVDHRAIDGATAAQYLQTLKDVLECAQVLSLT